MPVKDMLSRLEALCRAKGIARFEPEEIIALLEDGETVEWIIGQLTPDGTGDPELASLLEEIASQVAPVPAGEAPLDSTEGIEQEGEEEADRGVGGIMEELARMEAGSLPPGVDPAGVKKLLDSPKGGMLADFGVFCQERGVAMDEDQEGMAERLRELHEEWLDTPRAGLEGKRPSELLDGGGLFPRKAETYRREAPKVGRNDPCPCGSGKKYKKCCGRAA